MIKQKDYLRDLAIMEEYIAKGGNWDAPKYPTDYEVICATVNIVKVLFNQQLAIQAYANREKPHEPR